MSSARRGVLAALLVCGITAPALGAPKDFVVYISRLGGDTETAKPYIEKLQAQLETALGWPKGSCKGAFFAVKKEALAYINDKKPGFALLDPALYFELRQSHDLIPIAQLESRELISTRMHLVVKNPSWKGLDDLRGKKLWTTLAESPTYLSRVILEGKVDATKHFALKRIGHALKGVRAVLRGEADATLIDDDQLAEAKKMEGGAALRSVFQSPALPPLPVVVFGKELKAPEQKALGKVLLKLCSLPSGKEICQQMRMQKISPIKPEPFQKTQALYEKP